MKTISLLARLLLGILFFVFGLNGFLHFIPLPPPKGLAAEFFSALTKSHYMDFVMGLQVLGGILLLTGRFTPFAMTLLGPVIVNILLFHFTMAPEGLPLALVAATLWFVVFWGVRRAFSGIFASKVQPA